MKQIKSLLSVFVLTLAATACAGNSGENKKSNEPTKKENKILYNNYQTALNILSDYDPKLKEYLEAKND